MPPFVPKAGPVRVRALLAMIVLSAASFAAPAFAARIMDHNLLNWSASSGPARVPYMRAIARGISPDLVVNQELIDQGGVDLFRDQVLNFLWPGEWAAAPFRKGPDTNNGLFYRTSVFTFLDTFAVTTPLRDAMRYHLRLTGYTSSEAELYVYSFHLKASMGFEANRLAEMKIIRANAETLPIGSHIFFCGDYNVYTGSEPAFQWALSSIGNNVGRMKDPINQVGSWNNNSSYAPIHTQSSRTASLGDGGATGGMDDRFDFILESYNWADGLGFELLESTYKPYGNDGRHFNVALNGPLQTPAGPVDNLAVGIAMADSIMRASDHIPVMADLSVPSKIDVGGPIAFGTVIQGAAVAQDVLVTNAAVSPGHDLDYSFSAPAGFGAPGGPFALAPGATAPASISMNTTTVGGKGGDLSISSDAPDSPVTLVAMTGTVVAHAVASSESLTVVLDDTLDFGSHGAGGFNDQTARVYNPEFGALQARLSVANAGIVGGDGRFTLVEPFAPALVELEPALYDVHFDDTDAVSDSIYVATLTFDTADDPSLPGATAQSPVAYVLLARVAASTVAVEPGAELVTATVLYAPRPNPAPLGRSIVRYDIAQAGRVRLALFDVRGREVARLVDGDEPIGAHARSWNGRDAAGHVVPGGVYFAHLVAPGAAASTVRFVVLP